MTMLLSVRTACALLLGLSSAFIVRGQSVINETTLLVQEAIYLPKPDTAQCIARFQSVNPVSIIMVADDGTFSGTSEAVYILNTLKGQLKAPANSVPCQQLYTGTLLGQKVVLAISGIGPEASALCTTYITQCADLVKDFIYLGTSGWSAQKGGILNAPSSCAAANGPTARTRLGDVAVTPFSVNWQCKLASWTEQCTNFPNVCTYPIEDAGPTVTSLYGKCVFSHRTTANTELSDELIAVTKSTQFAASAALLQPSFNTNILAYETAYWNATSAGTGNVYAPFPAFARPSILDYTQSAELDAQFFFTGTPWEMVARNYTAVTLNMANNSTLTQYDVTVVNAEEGVGVSAALELFNSLTGVPKIKYTFVRSASDYLYSPVVQVSPGVWEDSPQTPAANFDTSYLFAIQTASTVVLTTFQLRCLAAGNSANTCAYSIV